MKGGVHFYILFNFNYFNYLDVDAIFWKYVTIY